VRLALLVPRILQSEFTCFDLDTLTDFCYVVYQHAHIRIPTEEGRAASESSHSNFGCFLSISQQEVSADIIQNSAVVML
jgi:hypothetical protein